ncbi:MAG: glycosyltransferase family 4 protein [Bacteroidetes bacterium]|nr:glycosyltransferase family 4 protein [Bacteroidota bacterium]
MSKSIPKKILFTSTFKAPFVKSDELFLSKYFQVKSIQATGINFYLQLLKNIFLIDLSFSWFLSTYSATVIILMRLLNKKSILILGGVDVVSDKNLNYGIWNNPFKAFYLKFAIKYATHILPVDESLKLELLNKINYDLHNIQVVPTSVDFNYWTPKGAKQNLILMVANIPDELRLKLKGADFFYELAIAMPEYKFILIGVNKNLHNNFPRLKNFKILEFLNQSELLNYYRKAKIFCQLSLHEGLPNTLLEAMSCGAIPVGTKVGGITTLVKSNGYFIERNYLSETKSKFKKAILSSAKSLENIRQHIISNYNPEKRESKILNLINN